jgi:hypothetical protein
MTQVSDVAPEPLVVKRATEEEKVKIINSDQSHAIYKITRLNLSNQFGPPEEDLQSQEGG